MRRLQRKALIVLVVAVVVLTLWRGWIAGFSVLVGGLLALLNHRWMSAAVDRALGQAVSGSSSATAVRYVLRLFLIFGTLFAMIRFSFLSLPEAVLGLSIFVLAGMLEAVVLLYRELIRNR